MAPASVTSAGRTGSVLGLDVCDQGAGFGDNLAVSVLHGRLAECEPPRAVSDRGACNQAAGLGRAQEVHFEVGRHRRLALLSDSERHRGQRFVARVAIAPPCTMVPLEVGKPCDSPVKCASSTSFP